MMDRQQNDRDNDANNPNEPHAPGVKIGEQVSDLGDGQEMTPEAPAHAVEESDDTP
jgi:hypothetical protein